MTQMGESESGSILQSQLDTLWSLGSLKWSLNILAFKLLKSVYLT